MTITRERVREAALGSERRLGFWILPLFLVVALLGATLAGSVVALYYAQQVRRLESTTADARGEVEQARQEITTTASEAQETIDAQMQQAREELAQEPPVESAHDAGVFAVSAEHAAGEVRVGSAFVVSSQADETYLATTYEVVRTGEKAVPSALVYLEGGPVPARVHNYDRDRDVATLILEAGPLPVPDWRPPEEPVGRGDPLYLVGLAGPGTPSVLEGRVAGVSDEAIVPTTPVNSFLAGAPLFDAAGRVVAMASLDYAPYGPVGGDPLYAVPLAGFCAQALDCTAADIGVGATEGDVGEGEPPQGPEGPTASPPEPPPPPPPEESAPQTPGPGEGGQQPSGAGDAGVSPEQSGQPTPGGSPESSADSSGGSPESSADSSGGSGESSADSSGGSGESSADSSGSGESADSSGAGLLDQSDDE